MKKRLLIVLVVLSSLMALCMIIWSVLLFAMKWLTGINVGVIAFIIAAAFAIYVAIYYIITGKLP